MTMIILGTIIGIVYLALTINGLKAYKTIRKHRLIKIY